MHSRPSMEGQGSGWNQRRVERSQPGDEPAGRSEPGRQGSVVDSETDAAADGGDDNDDDDRVDGTGVIVGTIVIIGMPRG